MKINMQNHEQVKIKQIDKKKIDKQEIVLCLILVTFKEQVDKLKLVELSN